MGLTLGDRLFISLCTDTAFDALVSLLTRTREHGQAEAAEAFTAAFAPSNPTDDQEADRD
ncbi:hypothetical protein D5S17_32945 [Pseudonocardiaceae bacterium YIM PH 21723]|nr:hypothetical protein D5S17_32945 [Pseudonocardiaceae bacterium YIM PH 21723]